MDTAKAAAVMDAAAAIQFLLLGGLLGLFGQGARAVVGLKTLSDYANGPSPSQNDVFNAARLAVSLVIGFLAGIAAALTYYASGGPIDKLDFQLLLGFAGAGYVGTDVIEAFIAKYLPQPGHFVGAPTDACGVSSSRSQFSMDDLNSLLSSYATVHDKLSSLTVKTANPSASKTEIIVLLKLIYPPADPNKYKDTDPIPAVDAGQADANLTKISDWFNAKGVSYRLGLFDLPAQKWTYDTLANALGNLFAKHGGIYAA